PRQSDAEHPDVDSPLRGDQTLAARRVTSPVSSLRSCRIRKTPSHLSSITIAVVVIAMFAPFALIVPATIAIPAVVVVVVAARRRPIALEVPSAFPIRFHPIGLRERWTRPIAVVPRPAAVDRVPIPFDPEELRTRLCRNAIHTRRRRRRAEREAERHLGGRALRRQQQQQTDD